MGGEDWEFPDRQEKRDMVTKSLDRVAPPGTYLKKDITPERALAEFKVAVEIWMSYMDTKHKHKAFALVRDKVVREEI